LRRRPWFLSSWYKCNLIHVGKDKIQEADILINGRILRSTRSNVHGDLDIGVVSRYPAVKSAEVSEG
jgi:hypothetical protein